MKRRILLSVAFVLVTGMMLAGCGTANDTIAETAEASAAVADTVIESHAMEKFYEVPSEEQNEGDEKEPSQNEDFFYKY